MSENRVLDITVKVGAGTARRELAALGSDMVALDKKAVSLGTGIGAGVATGAGKARAGLGGLKTELAATGAAAMTMAETHGAAMSRVGTAALGAGAVFTTAAGMAVKAAVDWESAWAGVTKTVDGADSDGGRLEAQLRELAKTLPFAHQEIARVAEAAGQLGVAKNDVAEFSKVTLAMGVATNMSADEAATQMARFNNIMGLSNRDVKHLGASIVDLGNNTATTEAEIMAMSLRLGGMGRMVGMKAADVTAVAASMSSVGVEAEAGGTAISQFWRQMDVAVTTGNEKLGAMAKTAGMTSKQFSELWKKDPAAVFTALEKGLGGLVKSGKGANEALAAMGVRQVRMSDSLLRGAASAELMAKNLERSRRAFAAQDKDNALLVEAQKRYETSASKMTAAKNRIVDSLIDMGQAIAPAVADTLDVLSKVVNGFTSLPGPVKSAIGVLTAFGGVSLLTVGSLAKILPMVVELRKAMGALAATDFAGTMLGSMGGGLVAKGKAAGKLYAQGFMAPLKGLGRAAGEVGLTALGTKLGGKLAPGAQKAAGGLTRLAGAAKGAAAAAIPLAGTATAAAVGIAAAGYATEKAAVALQNMYSGSKLVAGEMKNLDEAFLRVQAGASVSATMFGDISSKLFTSTQQMSYAVRDIANSNPFKFLEMPSNDDINARERLLAVLRGIASVDVSQTAATMKQLLSAQTEDLGISQLDAFKAMLDRVPELRQHYEELAKSMNIAADDATLLKIATGEIKQTFDEAGRAVAKTADQTRDGIWGDLIPQTKEERKVLDELVKAGYQAASGFINLGEGADKGLKQWHDAMIQQGQAVREWGANMLQAKGLAAQGLLDEGALEQLRQMGSKGAAILQEAMQQWRAGSTAGIDQLNDAFRNGGAAAAQTFAQAFASVNIGELTSSISQNYGAQAAKAFSDAISSGSIQSIEQLQSLMSQYPVKIPVEGDISEWESQLFNLKIQADKTTGTVRITGVDDEARAVLSKLGIEIAKTDGTVNLNAVDDKAKAVLAALGVTIRETDGTVTFTGDTAEAKKTLDGFVKQKFTTQVHAQADPGSIDRAKATIAGRLAGIVVKVGAMLSGITGGGAKKARGGYIVGPGSGTSDSIPAWLSNGEYVIRAAAVRKYGLDFMHRINAQKYARGGYVGAVRYGSDPATWLEENLKPITQTLDRWAKTLPGINATPTDSTSNRTEKIISDVTVRLEEINESIKTQTANDISIGSRADEYYEEEKEARKAEEERKKIEEEKKRAEEEKQRRLQEALNDYKSLFNDVKGYGKDIADAFQSFDELQKLLTPVAPEADKKGKITQEAIQKADEKNRENFEKAIEILMKLQEVLWNMQEGFANTWQVAGRERPPLDQYGKPVDWNVGEKIGRGASRQQVDSLIPFLMQAFGGMRDELGIVKETMKQSTSPMGILSQLKVGDSWKQRDKNGELVAQNTGVTVQKLGGLQTEFHSLAQNVGEIGRQLSVRSTAGTQSTQLNGIQRTTVPVAGEGETDLKRLAQPSIKVTPDVKLVSVDDINANVKILVKTQLNYSDLQAQTERAVASIKPPDIVVKTRLDAASLQGQTEMAVNRVVPPPIVVPMVTGASTM